MIQASSRVLSLSQYAEEEAVVVMSFDSIGSPGERFSGSVSRPNNLWNRSRDLGNGRESLCHGAPRTPPPLPSSTARSPSEEEAARFRRVRTAVASSYGGISCNGAMFGPEWSPMSWAPTNAPNRPASRPPSLRGSPNHLRPDPPPSILEGSRPRTCPQERLPQPLLHLPQDPSPTMPANNPSAPTTLLLLHLPISDPSPPPPSAHAQQPLSPPPPFSSPPISDPEGSPPPTCLSRTTCHEGLSPKYPPTFSPPPHLPHISEGSPHFLNELEL
nr:pollen-specific leucine-rich repeat extensin-like protein 1 [Penaeus vannamei]